jgi:Bacterial Ig-like domain (group 3)
MTYYAGSGTSGTNLGSTAPSAAGTYTVVARFPGSADYAPIQSAPTSFVIAPSGARIALTSSASAAVHGQAVTFVATVSSSAGTPSGTVTFFDGATPLGTVPLDSAGSATLTTSVLAVGSHSITATYNGTADLSSVESGSASESVARAGTQVVLVPHPVFRKKRFVSVDFTAEIEPLGPGEGTPTGRVAFELLTKRGKKIHTQMLGNVAVAGGQATLLVKASSVLNKSITIVYGGDADFGPSTVTSPRLTQKGLK